MLVSSPEVYIYLIDCNVLSFASLLPVFMFCDEVILFCLGNLFNLLPICQLLIFSSLPIVFVNFLLAFLLCSRDSPQITKLQLSET